MSFAEQGVELIQELDHDRSAAPWLVVCSFVNPHDIALYGKFNVDSGKFAFDIEADVPSGKPEDENFVFVWDQFEKTLNDDLKLKPGCQADYRRNYHTFVGDVDPEPYWRYYYQLHKNVDEQMYNVFQALLKSRYADNTSTALEVSGQSPGGEWLYVKNNEGIVGWVGALFVEGFLAEPPAPYVEPGDALVVTGLVKTELGTPVSWIGFALTQVGFSNRRSDAVTDKEGRFHAYLSSNLTGTLVVEQVSVACTSNTMDANCNCINDICGEAVPRSVEVTIPTAGELSFVWK